jgi:hypothetical protein
MSATAASRSITCVHRVLEPYVEEEWCWIVIHGAALWAGAAGAAAGGQGGPGGDLPVAPGISVVNPRSATLRTSDASTVSYSLMGALVGGGSSNMLQGGLPRVREWLKEWGRRNGRADDVDACERFVTEELARVAGLLGVSEEAVTAAAEGPDVDH